MPDKKVITVFGATGAQGGGLARAILNDPDSEFAVRAVTRDPGTDKAKALADLGAEVVAGDIDDVSSIKNALKGAYGAYFVTNFWEHFSPEKEYNQVRNMAVAANEMGLQHAVWSTLEDTRKWVPLEDGRMPTLQDIYKVPHFDAKGSANQLFVDYKIPTTFFHTSFYWDNMLYFGMGPKPGPDGKLAITFPMGDTKLSGISADDIGKCAFGIFKKGDELIGKNVGVAGEHITCADMAATLSRILDKEITYNDVAPDVYRSFDFPGADDLGNMFQFYKEFGDDFMRMRDLDFAKELNPELKSFEDWVQQNKERIPLD